MNGKSDNELMHELQNGNKAALDIIMDRWETPIKAYIYRITQSPDWVDELSQETFVKVFINASSFDIQRRFSPWVYSIATNLCRNWRRWKSRHPSIAQKPENSHSNEENSLASIQDPAQPINCRLEKKEDCNEVKRAIASLPDHLRSTLVLYYYQGLSYAEIAEAQNCSSRGVETRLYRAKKILHSHLKRAIEV